MRANLSEKPVVVVVVIIIIIIIIIILHPPGYTASFPGRQYSS